MDTETRRDILNFLKSTDNITAALATVTPEGAPRVATIYYFVDDEFNFYFLTATNTQKYNNLIENSAASLITGFGPGYTCVQGSGSATQLEKGSAEEKLAIARIKEHMRAFEEHTTWPIFQLEDYTSEALAAFKFTPDTLELLNLDKEQNLPLTDQTLLSIL